MVIRLSSYRSRSADGAKGASQLGTGLSEVLQVPNKIKNIGAQGCASKARKFETAGRLPSGSHGEWVIAALRLSQSAGARLLVAGAVGLALSGCGMSTLTSGMGGGMFGGGNTSSTGTPKRVTEENMLSSAKAEGGSGGGGDVAHGCPRFQVSARDHHVTIYEPGRAGDSLGVVHRGEITRTARECSIQGTRVTVKYGFSGRILLGPRGRPGMINLPVQVSVLDSKRASIASDRTVIESSVTLDNPVAYFSHVRTVTFEVPQGARPGDIDVFVGFERNTPGAG